MVYFLLNEFMAPAKQVVQEELSPDVNEDEQLGGLMAQLVLAKQTTFDKPARNRHMSEDHVWFEDRWMVASLCDE
jgi:hypothetical protein